ncbi:hypothetical protein J3F83DRAFT_735183 [Trichoderma novae-zelandiae]
MRCNRAIPQLLTVAYTILIISSLDGALAKLLCFVPSSTTCTEYTYWRRKPCRQLCLGIVLGENKSHVQDARPARGMLLAVRVLSLPGCSSEVVLPTSRGCVLQCRQRQGQLCHAYGDL